MYSQLKKIKEYSHCDWVNLIWNLAFQCSVNFWTIIHLMQFNKTLRRKSLFEHNFLFKFKFVFHGNTGLSLNRFCFTDLFCRTRALRQKTLIRDRRLGQDGDSHWFRRQCQQTWDWDYQGWCGSVQSSPHLHYSSRPRYGTRLSLRDALCLSACLALFVWEWVIICWAVIQL